jgi:hypothetical protein
MERQPCVIEDPFIKKLRFYFYMVHVNKVHTLEIGNGDSLT